MADIKTQITDSFKDMSGRCDRVPFLQDLEKKTNVQPVYLALGIVAVSFTTFYFVFGPGLLCNLLGFAYPVYASILAIESKRKDDDKQWLTYWVIYSFFSLIEHFTDTLLFWVPFYFSIKFGLLVWMMMPGHEGATFIYDRVLSPLVKQYLTDSPKSATSTGTSASSPMPSAAAASPSAGPASSDKVD